jgi:hypothetical protein
MSAFKMIGTKGSDVYTTTGDPLLDLNVRLVRGAEPTDLAERVRVLLNSGYEADTSVLMFHTRNVRGGRGERSLFHNMFGTIAAEEPTLAAALLDLVPEYGSWMDVVRLAHGLPGARKLLVDQLIKDERTPEGQSISLAARWAPREGSAWSDVAKAVAAELFPDIHPHSARMKAYRQVIAGLNRRLKTVETLMSAGQWDAIEPSAVPGRAGKLYSRAFLNLVGTKKAEEVLTRAQQNQLRYPNDPVRMACRARFQEHYAAAAKGAAKVHGADTLFPHEIVKKALEGADALAEEEKHHLSGVWRSMVEKVVAGGGLRRSIMMSDFSGSMRSSDTNGDTPYWVSMALGILGAQAGSGGFARKLMTFDSNPTWHEFPEGADLFGCLQTLRDAGSIGQGLSTDFQKAMDLVLGTLKAQRVRPGEEPENLIVLTDMGWDAACGSDETSYYTGNTYRHNVKTATWQTHVEMIRESFHRAGEDMWGEGNGWIPPRIVVWNLAANPQDVPATGDTPGVALLSGWSPTQFEILQREGPRQMTASELLLAELEHPRYDRVRERVVAWRSGLPSSSNAAGPGGPAWATHANGWGMEEMETVE